MTQQNQTNETNNTDTQMGNVCPDCGQVHSGPKQLFTDISVPVDMVLVQEQEYPFNLSIESADSTVLVMCLLLSYVDKSMESVEVANADPRNKDVLELYKVMAASGALLYNLTQLSSATNALINNKEFLKMMADMPVVPNTTRKRQFDVQWCCCPQLS